MRLLEGKSSGISILAKPCCGCTRRATRSTFHALRRTNCVATLACHEPRNFGADHGRTAGRYSVSDEFAWWDVSDTKNVHGAIGPLLNERGSLAHLRQRPCELLPRLPCQSRERRSLPSWTSFTPSYH